MPRHTFAAHQLQVSESGRPGSRVQVSDIDGHGLSLMDVATDAVQRLLTTPVTNSADQYHLSVAQHNIEDDRLELNLDYGKFGAPGTVKNVRNHQTMHEFGEEESATNELRNMLVVPAPGEYALFFAERHQGRGTSTAFLKFFKEFVDSRVAKRNLILRHDRLADTEAFRRFLERAKLLDIEVTELSSGPDLFDPVIERPVGTISHRFTPGRKQRWLPDPLRDDLLSGRLNVRDLFGLRKHADVKQTTVTLKDDLQGQAKVVVDESEQVPNLTYPLTDDDQQRPKDAEVYRRMLEVSDEICQQLRLGSH